MNRERTIVFEGGPLNGKTVKAGQQFPYDQYRHKKSGGKMHYYDRKGDKFIYRGTNHE